MTVASSLDQGKTWCYKYVEIEGAGRMPSPGDLDVCLLPDGTFRLFFTSAEPEARAPQILYAEGTDGIHFIKRGPVFGSGTEPVMDSFTVPIGGAWHMYTLGGIAGKVWHGISEDGRTFRFHDHADFSIGGRWYIPTNEVPLEDGRVRFYAFTPGQGGDIRSFLTMDGYSWEEEPGVRLALDASSGLEKEFVKDAAVARLGDGSYLMVYVTTIPE